METVIEGLSFPEGPRWHDGRLWFSDFYTHLVQSLDPNGTTKIEAEIADRPSGLGFLPDGSLLVVAMLDRVVLRRTAAGMERYCDLSGLAGGPCNDMIVDAAGRAYVGNFGYDKNNGEPARLTSLFRIDPDGSIHTVADDLCFPNGMAISPDGRTFIVGETFANRLTAFDLDPDGGLRNRRTFAHLPGCDPDGICLDAEGAVWVSDPAGKRALRVLDGGRIDTEITFEPGRGAYACVLGGGDRRDLYVLTNTGSGPAMAERRDGRIERTRVPVAGAGLP